MTEKQGLRVRMLSAHFGTIWQVAGREYKVTCPSCNTKAMWVNLDQSIYHCFSCSDGGQMKDLIPEWGTLYDSRAGKVHTLPEKSSVGQKLISLVAGDSQILPPGYRQVRKATDFPDGWSYILGRGVDPDSVEFGCSYEKDAVIFPMREEGRIVYWQSRSIFPVMKRKTDNPRGLSKSTVVYRIDSINEGGVCFLVEGIFDALRVGGIATLGKTCSTAQIMKIVCRMPKVVFVCYDDDAYSASVLAANEIRRTARGIAAIPIRLEDGDPADYGKDKLLKAIISQLDEHESLLALCAVNASSLSRWLLGKPRVSLRDCLR